MELNKSAATLTAGLAPHVSRSQLALRLGVDPDTITAWVRDQGFPRPARVGGKHLFNLTEVEEFLRSRREGPTSAA